MQLINYLTWQKPKGRVGLACHNIFQSMFDDMPDMIHKLQIFCNTGKPGLNILYCSRTHFDMGDKSNTNITKPEYICKVWHHSTQPETLKTHYLPGWKRSNITSKSKHTVNMLQVIFSLDLKLLIRIHHSMYYLMAFISSQSCFPLIFK